MPEEKEDIGEAAVTRNVEISLRVGIRYETLNTKIIGIDRENGNLTLLSPMSGPRPRPVKMGATIKLRQEQAGTEAIETELTALEQYHDEENDQWLVIAEQEGLEEDWEIKRRGFVRERTSFPINLNYLGKPDPVFEGTCDELSGSGMRVSLTFEGRDYNFKPGDEFELDFEAPPIVDENDSEIVGGADLPAFGATVVRAYSQVSKTTKQTTWILGLQYHEFSEEDQDIQDYLIRYVLKLQIVNQAMMA